MTAIEFPSAGIDDGVVRIRHLTESDLPALVAACRDEEVQRWTRVPANYGMGDATEHLARARSGMAAGNMLATIVVDATDDSFLGSCGVIEMIAAEQRCELGYFLAPEARGRGTMTRAVQLLCRWLFDELGMKRIAAGAEPQNPASAAVLLRAGFQREGVARSLFEEKGRRRDVTYYSLLRGEL